jgi:hypothetical protein
MAGLLEGEAYFFFNAKRLGIRLSMTDEDVVRKFADIWEVDVKVLKPRAAHHKTPFLAALPSRKAYQCMQMVLPYCGLRRAASIRGYLSEYSETRRRAWTARRDAQLLHSDESLIAAWRAASKPISIRNFCESLGTTSRKVVTKRLKLLGLIEADNEGDASCSKEDGIQSAPTQFIPWIAGILEGEGCFTPNGDQIRISVEMTDEDIIARLADYSESKYSEGRQRKASWKPTYCWTVANHKAYELMRQVLPWMGERRSAKIRESLSQYEEKMRVQEQTRSTRLFNNKQDELRVRWTNRVDGETLRSIGKEFGLHPQSLKNRLLELGVYAVPTYKTQITVQRICPTCQRPFTRKAARPQVYCSLVCSGRAAQVRLRSSSSGGRCHTPT